MSSITENQSRFGFHPCSHDVYLQLKFLHRCYWETLRQFHTWHRWNRKLPENRIGPEPCYCTTFVEDKPWAKPVVRHGEAGFKLYPRTVIDHDVLRLYHQARMPSADPVEAFPEEVRAEIERLCGEVTEYFSKEGT